MYFVAVACIVNIVLDFLFIGLLGMGAAGAALGTVFGQAVSVIAAFGILRKKDFGFAMNRQTMKPSRRILWDILKVGTPIALQDGLIQVAFVVITIIANSRGLIAAAGVGIVEKLIGFMFLWWERLVPGLLPPKVLLPPGYPGTAEFRMYLLVRSLVRPLGKLQEGPM